MVARTGNPFSSQHSEQQTAVYPMTAKDYGSRLKAGQKVAGNKHENLETTSPQPRTDCCNPHFSINFPDYAATLVR
ncbi:MAG TPA: hypothetical protein DEB70_01805 [Planctomycetaceae bacterium]|nr:hypothetical protein [Planctomycetaceae bacterium]